MPRFEVWAFVNDEGLYADMCRSFQESGFDRIRAPGPPREMERTHPSLRCGPTTVEIPFMSRVPAIHRLLGR